MNRNRMFTVLEEEDTPTFKKSSTVGPLKIISIEQNSIKVLNCIRLKSSVPDPKYLILYPGPSIFQLKHRNFSGKCTELKVFHFWIRIWLSNLSFRIRYTVREYRNELKFLFTKKGLRRRGALF
jgi:hypothetical protein